MITKEDIEKRLEGLLQEQIKILAQLNAFTGAINDCKYWLSQVTEETPKE